MNLSFTQTLSIFGFLCMFALTEATFPRLNCPNRTRTEDGIHHWRTKLPINLIKFESHNYRKKAWETCDGSLVSDGIRAKFLYEKLNPVETSNASMLSFTSRNSSTIEEILRLVAYGEEKIELSEQTDIILVVGMTGSGKSTLVQFLAGQPRQLESVKSGLRYTIQDHCGSVSNETIISKTLLPELTIDEETQTAFYDCPGFSDTRNESVEIANSFFIKKVADHGERLKIIIVVPHYSLSTNERNYFIKLLKQLVLFIKNVDAFSNGILLVSTMVQIPNGFNEADVFLSYKTFFSTVKNEIEEVWAGAPHLDRAMKILEIISSTNSNGDLTRIGIFRSPEEAGYLDDIAIFQCAKLSMERLFYENIEYCSKDDDDFGIGLSAEAQILIRDVVSSIDKTTITNLTSLSENLATDFIRKLNDLGNSTEIPPELEADLESLFSTSYPLCENENKLSPPIYISEIVENIKSFSNEPGKNEIILSMQGNADFLVFLQKATENQFEINPPRWVEPIVNLKLEVYDYLQNNISNIYLQKNPRKSHFSSLY